MDSVSLPSGRLGATLNRYVTQELVFPTVISLVGLTLLILTKDLLSFSDFVINRGFGVAAVALIAFYEIVPLAARTLPFAVLVGTLVGLGRLRADLEILAVEAAGVSNRKLVYPVLRLAAVMAAAGLLLSLFAAPWATRSLEASLRQMARENPGLALRAGTVREFSGVKLVAREVSARGDQLRGVLLWIPEHGQTIFAERGEFTPPNDGATQLVLYDGLMLRSPRSEGEETRFETFWQTLKESAAPVRRNEDFLTGVALRPLVTLAWAQKDDEDLARRAQMEFHRRLSYPAASIVFGLLAVPLALTGRHFSRAAGGVTGLLVTVVYYGLAQLGEGLVQGGVVGTGSGVWLPNVVVGVLAVVFLWRGKLGLWSRKVRRQVDFAQEPRRSEASLPRFQSYILQRYVARYYAQMLCLAFALLLVGYLLVDVLERLQWFARYHADMLKVVRFYGVRLPLLASRVVPMSLLLATALTVGVLSVHRELIGMRACGVSVVRALTPILFIAGVVAPGYFLLNEVIVPRTNTLADQLKEREIKARVQQADPLHMMIWYRAGTHVYQATQLDPRLGEAQEISIYDLGANGLPVSRIDARAARHIGNGVWELVDPVRIEISEEGLRETPVERRAQLGEAPSERLDTKQLSAWELAREIHDAEASGYNATTYRVDFHVKLAAPLACLLLPAVALFFAIGGPPFPGPALTIFTSSVLGVSYILLTGVCASLGYGGFLPPSLAGFAPAAGLATLTGVLARRSRGEVR
jgi:lipopolysaccharide export system permease protein